ncbi:MAG: trigger factor [Sulfuricella sp.]|nr:trigger factor [Sulfuricella sp.]
MQTENVVNSLERQLDISIPMAMFEAEVGKRIQKLARSVKMDGFRPGKVPMKVVAQQYGYQVRQEVLGEAVQAGFSEAVRQQNFKVAGNPRIDGKPSPEGSQDMVFSAVFEIYPDVVVGDISVATIDRPDVSVSDADLDKTIDILRKQRVTYSVVERAAATADQVNIDYHGKIGSEDFKGGQAKGYKLVLGEGRALKDFEDAVVGMKAGETKSFNMTFPEDYHAKELAGKSVSFEITLNGVEEPALPAIDAEFAKSLGIEDGDLGKMRDEIRKNVEREVKRRIRTNLKEQAMKALVEAVSFDLPKALVEMEIERLQGYAAEQMGMSAEKAATMSLPTAMFEEQAQQRVRLGLVLAQVVQANQIKPAPEQVRALVDEHAETFEQPEEVVEWYYASPERLSEVEAIALEDSVVNWVLEQAKVIDKAMSFDELMGNA